MSLLKPRQPTENELRLFAGLLIVLTGSLLFAIWYQSSNWVIVRLVLITLGALGLSGIVIPKTIRPFHRLLMLLMLPIGWVVSHCLLAVVYYLVITPIGIWRRYRHGDPLQRAFNFETPTYWEERTRKPTRESYFRQF